MVCAGQFLSTLKTLKRSFKSCSLIPGAFNQNCDRICNKLLQWEDQFHIKQLFSFFFFPLCNFLFNFCINMKDAFFVWHTSTLIFWFNHAFGKKMLCNFSFLYIYIIFVWCRYLYCFYLRLHINNDCFKCNGCL